MHRHTGMEGVLLMPVVVALTVGCGVRKSEVHLIPRGFMGPVVIVFGVPWGQEIPRDADDTSVYQIPADGVLFVREDAPPTGWYRRKYFYVDADGSGRREIPYKTDSAELQVLSDVVGVTGMTAGREVDVRWNAYVVGIPATTGGWAPARDEAVKRAVQRAVGSGADLPSLRGPH